MNTADEAPPDATPDPGPEEVLFICRPDDLDRLVEESQTPYNAVLHAPDVFEATLLLCRRPDVATVIVSLAGLYPEELLLIETVKRHRPEAVVIVADASRRGAALARATRLGADHLLTSVGMVPLRAAPTTPAPSSSSSFHQPGPELDGEPHPGGGPEEDDPPDHDPFLTTNELRALLGP